MACKRSWVRIPLSPLKKSPVLQDFFNACCISCCILYSENRLPRQYFISILCDQHLDFPLGGGQSVIRIYRPVVVRIHKYIRPSHIYHGFNGKAHSGNHEHFCTFFGHIAYLGFFMEFQSPAVTADFTDNAAAVFFGKIMDCLPHIT